MNIVTATFSAGCSEIEADRKLWQYDQEQILQLVGLDLPDAYQVEFSNSRDKGSAKPQIGGPDGVSIPDEYLTTGEPVYAFLVGHAGETDRETEKLVVIYVKARSQPTDEPITPEQQTIVDQLIAALTAGVAKAEDAAAQAEAAISYMPKIVDGTWWVYDAEAETWADTGIQAEGQDGVGISDAVLNADYTLTLTFTDGTSYTTPSIRGPKGEDAPTDYILVQPTEPTSETNALWINSAAGERVQLPTMADHQALEEDVAANTQELANQKSALDDLTDLVDRKAGMLVDTASGAIASFVPDATIPNLLGVSVDIEPVQDLHGFDSPWPAGGSVNKLSPNTDGYNFTSWLEYNATTEKYTVKQDTGPAPGPIPINNPIQSGTVVTVSVFVESGQFTGGGAVISIGGYYNGSPTSWQGQITLPKDTDLTGRTFTATTTTTAELNHFEIFIYGTPTISSNIVFRAQIELGSTPTVWHPRENICPISGWDAVEVVAYGVNLLPNDYDAYSKNNNYCYLNGVVKRGEIARISFTDKDTSVDISGCYIGFQTGLSQSQTTASDYRWAISNGTVQSNLSNISTHGTACDGIMIYPKDQQTFDKLFSRFDIMVELGSTATDYKPYAGNRYTIALGDTVYGGTLDVTNGTLTVDRAMVDMGTLTYIYQALSGARHGFSVSISDLRLTTGGADLLPAVSSAYSAKRYNDYWGNGNMSYFYPTGRTIIFLNNDYTDANEFKAAMSGVQLCYEFATPIVIDLDPVTISTISGQTNNVWADAGDVSVTYAADLKAYIDSKIAAAVAALS